MSVHRNKSVYSACEIPLILVFHYIVTAPRAVKPRLSTILSKKGLRGAMFLVGEVFYLSLDHLFMFYLFENTVFDHGPLGSFHWLLIVYQTVFSHLLQRQWQVKIRK